LVEAISGGARVIVNPIRTGNDDEQRVNALLFSPHYPVHLLREPADLESDLRSILEPVRSTRRPVSNLDFGGAARIRSTILGDLDSEPASAGRF
jgi:hypothetical protein